MRSILRARSFKSLSSAEARGSCSTISPASSPNSPDGKRIACTVLDERVNPKRLRVATIPFTGGPAAMTFDLPETADLSRPIMDGRSANYVRRMADGRSVACVDTDTRSGVPNLWSRPVRGGPPRPLTNFTSGLIYNFEISPDGGQVACSRGTRSSDVILMTAFR